ncbi:MULTISPECIES: lytic transglycosylase domain-containing protein [Sphingomonas]|jgi:soluble lytic murein transglycosylase-like protein|uniref:lytic transglycosylase domain-containing protein n=1 Tax=Sphingomonas TaxID=13687 RepID=UPI001AE6A18E
MMARIGVWSIRAAATTVLGLAVPVAAQVIEIGNDGQTNVYTGPTQFTAEGSRAIVPPAPVRERRVAINPTAQAAARAGLATGVSPALIEAVAWQESRFRAGVVSRAGAIGEMQLMPATARALGVDPYDSEQNYQGGALYLARLMRRYRGDLVLSLAAYNAGPGAVDRWRGVPPYRETREYVGAVLGRLGSTVEGVAPKFKQRNDR